MKHQYFGDVNDFRKYGLLRQLIYRGAIGTGICWMLTENDGGNDGNKREYLERRQEFRRYDPQLFDFLSGCVVRQSDPLDNRSVHCLENEDILTECAFFTEPLTDDLASRDEYFATLLQTFRDRDLIFFDPDNGLENRAPARGNADSCKFLYFEELSEAFDQHHSLLLYQHLGQRHMTREEYLEHRIAQLFDCLPVQTIFEFCTSFVAAFLIPCKRHETYFAQRAFVIERGPWGLGEQIAVQTHTR